MRNFWNAIRVYAVAAAIALSCSSLVAVGQGFYFSDIFLSRHLNMQGTPPVGVGCTIIAQSSDTSGSCTATAASGTITFASAYAQAPSCLLVDQSATPIAVWTESATVLTLTTLTSGHLYRWLCTARGT